MFWDVYTNVQDTPCNTSKTSCFLTLAFPHACVEREKAQRLMKKATVEQDMSLGVELKPSTEFFYRERFYETCAKLAQGLILIKESSYITLYFRLWCFVPLGGEVLPVSRRAAHEDAEDAHPASCCLQVRAPPSMLCISRTKNDE